VKILFIGDIVGQPGRRAVKELLPALREKHGVNLVIANGENAAGGSGITPKTAAEIFAAGVAIISGTKKKFPNYSLMKSDLCGP
jgi:calcineurin-like phosphoesterase